MQALVYDGQLEVVKDYRDPKPASDEVVVDVALAGICRTDIEVTRGYMEFRGVLGHEFTGVVSAAGGPAGQPWIGRRVTAEINCVCGKCEMCLAGLKTHCFNRSVLGIDGRDGCMAEQVAVPVENLCPIPDALPDETAVFVEPLAAALQVAQQVRPNPKERCVIIGDGRLAQLIAQVLLNRNVRPMVIGINEHKMRRLERLGVSCQSASEARPRKEAHLVIEASGSVEGFRMAMAYVRPRGTIVLKSTLAGAEAINLSPLVVDEVCVLGSRCGPFSEAMSVLALGQVSVDGLVTHEFALSDGVKAMEAAQSPDALKVLIRP